MSNLGAAFLLPIALAAISLTASGAGAQTATIYEATIGEPEQKTPEVSTKQMREILANRSAIVLDTRPPAEFANGHIPGAQNLKVASTEAIAAVDRLVSGDKSKALVLYCNGPFCQASRRMSDQLVAAGFTNVRRYQLGMPIWRALGGPTEIALEGVDRIYRNDRTAVFLDARSPAEFSTGSLAGSHNLPSDKAAKVQGSPMPVEDFNTRVVVFGSDAAQARALAEALSKRPWHNVAYFAGAYEELSARLKAN